VVPTLAGGLGDSTLASAMTDPSGITSEPGVAETRADDGDGEDETEGDELDESPFVGTLVGEYQVTGIIGEGGMGTVYSGEQPVIGKQVAIKVLKQALSNDDDVVDRFLAEAKAVNKIRHPNIIDIFSFGRLKDGSQYFVMEHLQGRSLGTYLKEHKPVGYRVAMDILDQVLDALHAAHEHGIVHRDLKPDNIYLADRPGGGVIVKLLDFGVAKFTEEGISVGHTRTGVPIGTPLYMSPEQCRGRDVSHASDLYSLGVIMYEMFTGRPPFAAKTIYELVNSHVSREPTRPSTIIEFPDALERIILWCLAKDQSLRPASASELRAALLPVLKELAGPDETAAPTPMPPLPEDVLEAISTDSYGRPLHPSTHPLVFPRQRRIWYVLGTIAVSAVVAVAVVLVTRQTESRPAPPAPPAATDASDTAPMRRRPERTGPERVLVQFTVIPASARATIRVNGETLKSTEHWVARSDRDRLDVRVDAPGYAPYRARPLPISNLYINVPLVRLPEPERRTRPQWVPRHHGTRPTRPRDRPADMRDASMEVRVMRFDDL